MTYYFAIFLRLRTLPIPEDTTEKSDIEIQDSETIVVQTASIQESGEHVNLTINHNPATVETEAEAVLSDKVKENISESGKDSDILHGEAGAVVALMESARTSCMLIAVTESLQQVGQGLNERGFLFFYFLQRQNHMDCLQSASYSES